MLPPITSSKTAAGKWRRRLTHLSGQPGEPNKVTRTHPRKKDRGEKQRSSKSNGEGGATSGACGVHVAHGSFIRHIIFNMEMLVMYRIVRWPPATPAVIHQHTRGRHEPPLNSLSIIIKGTQYLLFYESIISELLITHHLVFNKHL